MKFTDETIAALTLPANKKDLIYFDDAIPGFGVRIRAGGKVVWIAQYRVNGRTKRQTLGDVRKVNLVAARVAAKKCFAAVTLGGDPQAAKTEARVRASQLLGCLFDQYLEAAEPELRPNSYVAVKRYLTKYYFKSIRRRPVHEVKRRDVAAAIDDITKKSGKTSAARARSALSAFYVWAIKRGLAEENPVIGTADPGDGLEPRDRVLDKTELRAIWKACADDDFGCIVKLLFLTACRRDEIGGLSWSEIDLDGGMLHIPGNRTKNHQPLDQPLPPAAASILKSVFRQEGRNPLFGGGAKGFNAWSYVTLALHTRIAEAQGKALARWTLHDIRRSVATHMGEDLGIEPWIIELVLNHRGHQKGVAGVYNRSRYLPQVRGALLLWADHLMSIVEDRPVNRPIAA